MKRTTCQTETQPSRAAIAAADALIRFLGRAEWIDTEEAAPKPSAVLAFARQIDRAQREQEAERPGFAVLDTYPADLLNETPPRREDVSEIQDRERGELLCYAAPDQAERICRAVNAFPDLLAAAERALAYLELTAGKRGTLHDVLRAAIARATGGKEIAT